MLHTPELLAPAGNFEKFKVAINYGADAVYLGGLAFGLRSSAGNFSYKNMEKALNYAHKNNVKVYLTMNTYPKNEEMDDLESYIKMIGNFEFDAVIVADLGVFNLASSILNIPIHISTQASVSNLYAVEFWKAQGASRIILAREISILEAAEIYKKTSMDLEMFIHGSMCMAYSGKCTISNYTANRDANRGGCVNSCRWDYKMITPNEEKNNVIENEITNTTDDSYLMNSKDLQAVELIPQMIKSGIRSFKIEGRMKSLLYLASTVSIYRKIIDSFLEKGSISHTLKQTALEQIYAIPNRDFTDGFLTTQNPDKSSVLYNNAKPKDHLYKYIGIVLDANNDFIFLEVKNPFIKNDDLYIINFKGEKIKFKIDWIKDIAGDFLEDAKINNTVFINPRHNIETGYIIYK